MLAQTKQNNPFKNTVRSKEITSKGCTRPAGPAVTSG